MENHNEDIDQLLFSQLGDASMDAEGIDWNAFNGKRKKRRILFWLFSLLGLALIGGLSVVTFNFEGKNEVSKKSAISSPIPFFEHETGSKDTLEQDCIKYLDTDKKNSSKSKTHKKQHNEIKVKSELPEKLIFKQAITSTEENLITESAIEKQESLPVTFEEINVYSEHIPSLFTYTKPNYKAEKISENLRQAPVFNIKKLKLYWEIQAGPSLNIPNFRVTNSGKAFIHKDYETIRKASESAVSGYNFQLALGKSVNRWNYSLGFGFSSFMIQGNYNYSYTEKPVIDMDGKIKSYLQSSPSTVQFTSKQTLSFIEVPVSVQYLVIDKQKFGVGLRLGYIPQFLTQINGELPNPVFLDERESMTTENFKIKTSSIQGGLQFLYRTSKNSTLILMPEYRRGLGFKQVQSHYKTNFNYWGLNLTYRMAL